MKSKKRIRVLLGLLILIIVIVVLTKVGFYTIQPSGALPEGSTWLVWKARGEPYFNSPDAVSLKAIGSVSLMSRGFALAHAPKDRIILRLPYWDFAYLRSTGGKRFKK